MRNLLKKYLPLMVGVFAVGVLASCDEEQDQDIFGTPIKSPSEKFQASPIEVKELSKGVIKELGDDKSGYKRIYANTSDLVFFSDFNEEVTVSIKVTSTSSSATFEKFLYSAALLDSSNAVWEGYSDTSTPFEKGDLVVYEVSLVGGDMTVSDTLILKGVPTN